MRNNKIQMLNRLNYYSRYNRIKTPKEIQTLYHLVQDLNLDAIVTDDLIQRVSCLRDNHHIYRQEMKRNEQNYPKESVDLNLKDVERSEGSRRNRSHDKSSERSGHVLRDQIIQYLKLNTSRDPQNSHLAYEQASNYTQRQHYQKEPNQVHEKTSSQQNRHKTNNLSEINCLETESIRESEKQASNQPHSPINKLQTQSHQEDDEQMASQFFGTNQKDIGYLKSSNFADEFSEGLAELHKVDDVRNSSYYKQDNQANNGMGQKQSNDQECQSQKLYRLYGSDLEMEATDREDEIAGDYEDHLLHNHQMLVQQQHDQHYGIPKIIPVEIVFNQTQSQIQTGQHHTQTKNFSNQHQHDYNCAEQELSKIKQVSIDQRIVTKIENQEDSSSSGIKILNKGLTEGRWPVAETQKSIESIIQQELSPLPETLIQGSGLGEKQRKPFKKVMMDRKLNPRMVTSTFVNDPPVKKVNFKKMIKKDSIENRTVKQFTPENKKPKQIKPVEEKKQLLKAFFDQN